jgi:MraZ protein
MALVGSRRSKMIATTSLPFLGTFTHAFDEKGRITVPREWRGDGFESRLVVLPAHDGRGSLLRVFSGGYLTRQSEKLASSSLDDPRRMKLDNLFAAGQMLQMDAQNRVAVREDLRKAAQLDKNATLVGVGDHFQIWNPETYQSLLPAMPTVEQVMREVGL